MTDTVITAVNSGLIIEELKKGIRFGTDALLLADFVQPFKNAAELGSGSGIISLLLLSAYKDGRITGIEFNGEAAAISLKNAANNDMKDRFTCITDDVLNVSSYFKSGEFDCVFTNPPYLKNDCGLKNSDENKFSAFHETTAGIDDFVSAASYLLKYGGRFFAVYRPEYLSKLFRAMEKYDIRPKKLRIVYPSYKKPPCLILVEGKKAGRDGLITELPFFIYNDSAHTAFSSKMTDVYTKFKYV